MRADNSGHLIAAARRRSEAAHRRVVTALRRMYATGGPVSFDTVAKRAAVSRSWLSTQPDLRAEIDRLRQRRRPASGRLVPDRQRITDASLQQRLVSATERIRKLHADNQRLRTALAETLGANRDVNTRTAGRDTPMRGDTSRSIGPGS
jgi:chromosome segregation ATPase